MIAFTHWNAAGSFVAVKHLALGSLLQRECKFMVGLIQLTHDGVKGLHIFLLSHMSSGPHSCLFGRSGNTLCKHLNIQSNDLENEVTL